MTSLAPTKGAGAREASSSALTLPQRRTLEAIAAERITYSDASHRFYTLTRDYPRARQSVVERIVQRGFAEVVFRESSRQGVLVLTDSGREALGPVGAAA